MPSLLDRFLLSLAQIVFRRARLIVWGSALLVGGSAFFAWQHLDFKTSSSDLTAEDTEIQKQYRAYQHEFRDQDDFVVLIEGADPEINQQAIETLAAAIRQDPLLSNATGSNLFYKVAPPDRFESKLLFFLSPEELRQLRTQLEQLPATGEFRLDRLSGDHADDLPQLLDQLTAAVLRSGTPGPAFSLPEALPVTYLSDAGGTKLLLLLTPLPGEDSFTPHSEKISRLRDQLNRIESRFPGVSAGLTGEPVLNDDEIHTYQRDMNLALGITAAAVFLIFAYAYRQVIRPLLKLVFLVAAIVVTLGFTAATVGHLNMISVAVLVMIMGLGDDFAIYVITRFEEERETGASPEHALERALVGAGHSVTMAAITTATCFATMMLTGFLGLIELGFIAAGGLLICALLSLTLLPAMLLQQHRERHGHRHEIRHHLTPLLQRGERFWLHLDTAVVVLIALLTVGAAVSIVKWREIPAVARQWPGIRPALERLLKTHFEYDLLDLQNPSLDSVQTARRLNDVQSIYFAAAMADSLPELRRVQGELARLPSVERVVSILGASDQPEPLIPPRQDERRADVARVIDLARTRNVEPSRKFDLAAFRQQLMALEMPGMPVPVQLQMSAKAFVAALDRVGPEAASARLSEFQLQMGESLRKLLAFLRTQKAEPVQLEDLPDSLRKRYVGQSGKYLLEIYPRYDVMNKPSLEAFCRDVLSVAPKATSTPIQLNVFIDQLRRGYSMAALYALAFVVLVIFLYFRRLVPTVLCLLPLAGGTVLLLAVMSFTGLSFNPANIITLPLILGIGVDNGILILERFRREPDIALFSCNLGRAIIMSNLSTVIAFAALAGAHHQGVASLGKVMALGIAFTMVISLTALPALIHLLKRLKVPM